jgi:hypothetical protein
MSTGQANFTSIELQSAQRPSGAELDEAVRSFVQEADVDQFLRTYGVFRVIGVPGRQSPCCRRTGGPIDSSLPQRFADLPRGGEGGQNDLGLPRRGHHGHLDPASKDKP